MAKTLTFERDAIVGTIVTAWEYGVGYWADADLLKDNDGHIIGMRLFEKDERTGKYVKTYRVGLAKVDAAMEYLSLHPIAYQRSYPMDIGRGEADAIMADAIIQQAVFGEIIYG